MARERLDKPATVDFEYVFDVARPAEPISLEIRGYKSTIFYNIHDGRCFHEAALLEYAARNAPRGGLWVDVGAHVGNHAVYFAKFLADRVLCVEPDPELLPALRRNLEANGAAGKTVVFEGVAGATPGRRAVTRYTGGEIVVDVATVDALVEPCHLPVRFIKIDTDGMDMAVLRGAERTLRADRPHVAVELSTPGLRRDVPELMAAWNYGFAARFFAAPVHYYRPKGDA